MYYGSFTSIIDLLCPHCFIGSGQISSQECTLHFQNAAEIYTLPYPIMHFMPLSMICLVIARWKTKKQYWHAIINSNWTTLHSPVNMSIVQTDPVHVALCMSMRDERQSEILTQHKLI